ncbi:hypothetical protein O2K51_03255 [Apibacter raozihei]|uniref:hypothetical protein n=1 Tax=Apibacter raozihei TaxID=2500547 RepID=UPI000FE34266|nr:hypothetical protein [Apibacter raozihei]
MKKILFALLLPIFSMAQQEKINFTHKLVYELNFDEDSIELNLYYSPNGNVVDMGYKKMLLKDQLFVPLEVDLDGTANFQQRYSIADSIPSFTLSKTIDKDKINGISCNYYDVQIKDKNESEFRMCISENNQIDLLGILPVTNRNIKGLIVKLESKNEGLFYVLKSINKTNSSISLDWKKIVTKIKEDLDERNISMAADSVAIPYDGYDEDSVAVDSASVGFTHYNSQYKTLKIESANLAVDQLEKDSPYWEGLPVYCKELDQKVSVFKNSSLKKHARDYAGQLCDLYLSEIKEYSVDIKGTLDQIRYEENYFRNTVFDKADRKILDIFLNGLD